MTFTTSLKEEISKLDCSPLEARCELEAFSCFCGKIKAKEISFTLENASVARKIYQDIKTVFDVNISVTVRIQKRFRIKQIYILTIKDKIDIIKKTIKISDNVTYESNEEKIAFLKGAFLAVGNISNPQTSGYHLEYICPNEKLADLIKNLLLGFNLNAKTVIRGYKVVTYLKASENISDLLKLFKATSSMFFFEDIRIYRDHKNMVNRLNNCEISNQTKVVQTGLNQIAKIKYLKDNQLIDILDEKTKIVIEAREKYPESSLTELADIITNEYNYKIGKSGVNHHFIKINGIIKKHQNK